MGDGEPANEPLCPHFHDHTPQPHGWFQWWEWVAKMKKTHKQTKCSGCGLWVIWIPRPGRLALSEGEQNG